MQMNTRLLFYGSLFPLGGREGGRFSRTQRMPRAGIPHHPGLLLGCEIAPVVDGGAGNRASPAVTDFHAHTIKPL